MPPKLSKKTQGQKNAVAKKRTSKTKPSAAQVASTTSVSPTVKGGRMDTRSEGDNLAFLAIIEDDMHEDLNDDHGSARESKFATKKQLNKKAAQLYNGKLLWGDRGGVPDDATKARALKAAEAESLEAADKESKLVTHASAGAWYANQEKAYIAARGARGLGKGDTGSGLAANDKKCLTTAYWRALDNHFGKKLHIAPEPDHLGSCGAASATEPTEADKAEARGKWLEQLEAYWKSKNGQPKLLHSYLTSGQQDKVQASYLLVAMEFLEKVSDEQLDEDCAVEPTCTKTQVQQYDMDAEGEYDVLGFLKAFPKGINAKTIQDYSLFVLNENVILFNIVQNSDKKYCDVLCLSLPPLDVEWQIEFLEPPIPRTKVEDDLFMAEKSDSDGSDSDSDESENSEDGAKKKGSKRKAEASARTGRDKSRKHGNRDFRRICHDSKDLVKTQKQTNNAVAAMASSIAALAASASAQPAAASATTATAVTSEVDGRLTALETTTRETKEAVDKILVLFQAQAQAQQQSSSSSSSSSSSRRGGGNN